MAAYLIKTAVAITVTLNVAFITLFLKQHVEYGGVLLFRQKLDMANLFATLDAYNPPFSALLIDVRILKGSEIRHDSNFKVKVAVSMQNSSYVVEEDFPQYDIIYYDELEEKNYLRFFDIKTRIIPKINFTSYKNFLLPINFKSFIEFWKRSELRKCIGLDMVRPSAAPYLPTVKTLESMSSLMMYLVSFDIYPFLNGGTLLGWFRECDIISHTRDVDFAAFVEEYNPQLLIELQSNRTKFRLKRILGRVNDSYEFTVRPLNNGRPDIDLFWMYNSKNESWVGGTGGDGTKYKYSYPRIHKICAGDLLGHVFWVPCDPLAIVSSEYGPRWYMDHSSKTFSWKSSHYNVKRNGKFTASEMKEVYRTFGNK